MLRSPGPACACVVIDAGIGIDPDFDIARQGSYFCSSLRGLFRAVNASSIMAFAWICLQVATIGEPCFDAPGTDELTANLTATVCGSLWTPAQRMYAADSS